MDSELDRSGIRLIISFNKEEIEDILNDLDKIENINYNTEYLQKILKESINFYY